MFYSLAAFEHSNDWNNIPVFMPEVDDAGHPDDFDIIFAGKVPEGYRKVGYITGAHIADEGAARLEAEVVLNDTAAEELAKAGTLALSTGFVSNQRKVGENEYEITGRVLPNHVLAFKQGVCPHCYPNDQAAMMTNQMEKTMTEEVKDADFSDTQKGFLTAIVDKIKNACTGVPPEEKKNADSIPAEEQTPEQPADDIEALKAEVESLRAAVAERDATIAELKAADEQREKDEAWNTLANTLPPAWKEDMEKTRAEFEANPAGFTTKLMNHMQKFSNTAVVTKAEGKADCGCPLSEEQRLKNTVESNSKKIGFTPME